MTELTNNDMANAWRQAETELAKLMARLTRAEKALAEANRTAGAALESNSANTEELDQARRRIAELVFDRDRYWKRAAELGRELQEEKAAHRATCVQLAQAQQDEATANRVAVRVPELERELEAAVQRAVSFETDWKNALAERAELERKLAEAEERAVDRVDAVLADLFAARSGAAKLAAELAEAQDRLKAAQAELEKELEETRARMTAAAWAAREAQTERAELGKKLEAAQSELEAVRGRLRRMPWSAEEADSEMEALRDELKKAQDARDALSFDFARFRDTAERAQQDMLSQRDTWAERAKEAETAAANADVYRNMAATDRDAWRTRAQSLEKAAADQKAFLETVWNHLGAARLEKANIQAKLDEAQAKLERAEPLFAAVRAWVAAPSNEAALGQAAWDWAKEEARHA